MEMEGSGSGLPYYYQHHLLHLPHGQGEAVAGFGDGSEAAGMFPSPSASSAASEGGGNPAPFPQPAVAAAAAGGRASATGPATAAEPVRRKRGRPRKYGPAHTSPLPAPPSSSSSAVPPFSPPSAFSMNKVSSSPSIPLASSPPPRAAPGRRKAQHESVGKGGQSFTPHLLTVAAGKDVVQEIMSFVQQQKRAVCIISASGAISSATLRQPAMSGGHVTYEGHFDIVSLSGSFLLTETGGAYSRTGALSVCLSNVHNTVGGGVSGPLVAAGTVLIVAGSFSISSDKNVAACANLVKDTVNKLPTPFPEPDVSPSVIIWPTPDSVGRMSNNSVPDDRRESTGGSGNSFMLQPGEVHVMPSQSSTDLGVRQETEQLGGGYRSPKEGDDAHIQETGHL